MTFTSPNKQAKSLDYSAAEPSHAKHEVLAQQNGWSSAYARGYIEGELAHLNNTAPTIYVMVGIDEYCLGFRARYFEIDREKRQGQHQQNHKVH